jgi:hypothetical protein
MTISRRIFALEALRRVVKPPLCIFTYDDEGLTEEQQEQKANAERIGQDVRVITFRTVYSDYDIAHQSKPWRKIPP